jgi:hypothetical protein
MSRTLLSYVLEFRPLSGLLKQKEHRQREILLDYRYPEVNRAFTRYAGKKKKKKKLHLSSREGMMRCPQNTQKPKLQRTTRGGQTKVKNKKEPAKRGRGEGKKKGGGGEQPHTWPRPSQRSRLKSARAWNASEIKETTARKSACQMNCRRDLEGPLNNWG